MVAHLEENGGLVTTILGFLRNIALIALGVLLVAALICWVVGWRTANQYGMVLEWAGAGFLALGLASQMGGWGVTRSPDVLLAQSAGQEPITDRTRRTVKDLARSYDFLITMAMAGVVPLVAGLLIRSAWA